ncbi:putative ABC transporter permease [Candidatus Formimonas warabiya]|uniref:putative ABC transporter permease n=1 Tax=Formimonas warabiya TaxID=1761012 RepID=UPI0011D13DBC|nr:putative ABC transporter permease [Candidatus Formimonas warabiya]
MDSFRDALLFFAIYSFLGWLLETVFASVREKRWINRGFLTACFCPIYGFGALIIIQISQWMERFSPDPGTGLLLSILLSVVLVTALEYITGFAMDKIFHFTWWDYHDEPANLHGYICLKYSLIWGVLSYLVLVVIQPGISGTVLFIPVLIKNYLGLGLILYLIVDTTKSVMEAWDLKDVILNYAKFPVHKYRAKIMRYQRFFHAFPRLLVLNAEIVNRDVRSIIHGGIDTIKDELKSRFQHFQ